MPLSSQRDSYIAIFGKVTDVIFIYHFCRALRVLVHEGNLVNGRGRDNARAEGECIIRPRPLTRLQNLM